MYDIVIVGAGHGSIARYQNKVKNIKINLLMKNLKSPAMFHPFLRQLAMKSGIQSIKQLFTPEIDFCVHNA